MSLLSRCLSHATSGRTQGRPDARPTPHPGSRTAHTRALGALLLLLLAGCGSDGPTGGEEPVAEVVASPDAPQILLGDTVRLTAEARDGSGRPLVGRVISWSTDRSDIATVDAQGLVRGMALGTARITAATGGRSATVSVEVMTTPPVPVGSVQVEPETAELVVGDTLRLTATLRAADDAVLTGRAIAWASLFEAVATVDSAGLVRAVSEGFARITASSGDKADTTMVEVFAERAVAPTITTLTPATIQAGWGSFTLVVRGSGFVTTSRVHWAGMPIETFYAGSEELAATVSPSEVAVPGIASITVETPRPTPLVSNELRFTIFEKPALSIELRTPGNAVFLGNGVRLAAVAHDPFGEVIEHKTITWSSSDSTVLDLSGDRAHGLKAGFVTLTAYAHPVSTAMLFSVMPPPNADLLFETYLTARPELFSRSLEPGGWVRRLRPPDSHGQQAEVSPDGTRIAFVSDDGTANHDVYTMDRDGSDVVRLTHEPGIDDQPTWSPDGGRLAFRSFRAGKSDIWIMNADGTGPVNLTGADAFVPEEYNDAPAWSPASGRIAFSRGFGLGQAIFVVDADGTNLEELIPWASGSDRLDPAWSPDGGMLAYRAYDRTSTASRILVTTDAGTPILPGLSPLQDAGAPAWIDGSWIATTSAALPAQPNRTVVLVRLGFSERVVPLTTEYGVVTGVSRMPR